MLLLPIIASSASNSITKEWGEIRNNFVARAAPIRRKCAQADYTSLFSGSFNMKITNNNVTQSKINAIKNGYTGLFWYRKPLMAKETIETIPQRVRSTEPIRPLLSRGIRSATIP
jgi:hypothetical protein